MVSGREARGPPQTRRDPMRPLEPERALPPARWPLAPTLGPGHLGVPDTETQKCLCSLWDPWRWGCGSLLGSGGQNLQA